MKIKKGFLTIIKKEEGITMKKWISTAVILAVIACFAVTAQAAATVDKTVSVTASASITGTTALSRDVSAFTYGTTSADVFPTVPANKRVVLTYASNYSPWKIAIYTNNTQILNKLATDLPESNEFKYGRYAKGGLVSGTAPGPFSVVPLKWVAKSPTSVAPDAALINWTALVSPNFVKDKRDQDDPITIDDLLTTTKVENEESWAVGFLGGYPTVAWGPVVGGGGVCVDAMNTAPGLNQYRGDPISGSVAVYVAGLFATSGMAPAVPASAGAYSGTIYFDLYHE